jgi:hypothetical protein
MTLDGLKGISVFDKGEAYVFSGGIFPVNDFFDILLFDAEAIAVSHGALEQDFNRDG